MPEQPDRTPTSSSRRNSADSGVAPVERSHDQARRNYDRLARWYDLMASPFESRHRHKMLEMLDARRGESVLDVGFGTGDAVCELARSVGDTGTVAGIDISAAMKEVAAEKLRDHDLAGRAELHVGDACSLPFDDDRFDGACASFTLELFDIDEMQTVLGEIRRVLRPDGRLAIASLSNHRQTVMSRLYVAARRLFPAALDCRPIPVEDVIAQRHFDVRDSTHSTMAGIPVAVVVATPREG